jgi:hypothetical protein
MGTGQLPEQQMPKKPWDLVLKEKIVEQCRP